MSLMIRVRELPTEILNKIFLFRRDRFADDIHKIRHQNPDEWRWYKANWVLQMFSDKEIFYRRYDEKMSIKNAPKRRTKNNMEFYAHDQE